MTALRVKVPEQLASHNWPNPINVLRKPVIRRPLSGNPGGRWGKGMSPVPVNFWVFHVAVLTTTFGSARSMLTTGAYVAK